jgi:hypothetical protein
MPRQDRADPQRRGDGRDNGTTPSARSATSTSGRSLSQLSAKMGKFEFAAVGHGANLLLRVASRPPGASRLATADPPDEPGRPSQTRRRPAKTHGPRIRNRGGSRDAARYASVGRREDVNGVASQAALTTAVHTICTRVRPLQLATVSRPCHAPGRGDAATRRRRSRARRGYAACKLARPAHRFSTAITSKTRGPRLHGRRASAGPRHVLYLRVRPRHPRLVSPAPAAPPGAFRANRRSAGPQAAGRRTAVRVLEALRYEDTNHIYQSAARNQMASAMTPRRASPVDDVSDWIDVSAPYGHNPPKRTNVGRDRRRIGVACAAAAPKHSEPRRPPESGTR